MKIYTIFDETHGETLSFGFLDINKAIDWIAEELMEYNKGEVEERLFAECFYGFGLSEADMHEALHGAIEDGVFEDIYGIRTIEVEE